ncbi:MAG: M48 family metalloprotease [Phycisphaerae bacterium]
MAVASGCGSLATSGRLLSTTDEITLGERIRPEFERMLGGRVQDEDVQRYVQRVGQRIAAVAGRRLPYEFAVLPPDVANYFVLPGGKVYLTKGMVAMLDNENELAAILANAVGHACHRQPVKYLFKRMKGGTYLAIGKLAVQDPHEDGYRTAVRLARELILSQATRRDELNADKLAVEYLVRAGYSPWGLPDVQHRIYKRCLDEPKPMTKLYQSHPINYHRMKVAKVAVEVEYEYFTRRPRSDKTEDFAAIRGKLAPKTAAAENDRDKLATK